MHRQLVEKVQWEQLRMEENEDLLTGTAIYSIVYPNSCCNSCMPHDGCSCGVAKLAPYNYKVELKEWHVCASFLASLDSLRQFAMSSHQRMPVVPSCFFFMLAYIGVHWTNKLCSCQLQSTLRTRNCQSVHIEKADSLTLKKIRQNGFLFCFLINTVKEFEPSLIRLEQYREKTRRRQAAPLALK